MAELNTTELKIVMREIVDPTVHDLTKSSAILWNLIGTGEGKDINGRGIRIMATVRRNPSMLWFSEGGKYPAGGTPRRIEMNVTYARFAIAGRMTRDVIDHSSNTLFIKTLTDSVRMDTKTALKEFNQQTYQTGDARKAVVLTRDSATNITCAAPFGARQLMEEGNYSIYAGTARGAYVVGDKIGDSILVSKTNSTGVAVFDAVHANVIAGDIITWENSYGKAIHGLPYHLDDGTGLYQNKSRGTYSNLRSLVYDGAGSTYLSIAILQKLEFQAKYLRGADKEVLTDGMFIISSPTQANRYLGFGAVASTGITELPQGRILDMGYKGFRYNGMNWIIDEDCPDDEMYMLNTAYLFKAELKPLAVVPLVGNENGLAPIPAFDTAGAGSYLDSAFYALTAKMELYSTDPQMLGVRLKRLGTGNGLATGSF